MKFGLRFSPVFIILQTLVTTISLQFLFNQGGETAEK